MLDLGLILDKCKCGHKIFIYGDGEVGRLLRIFLHENGVEIAGFLTTNVPNHRMLMNVPEYKLEDINDCTKDSYIIVCMHMKWWEDAENRLRKLDFNNYVVIDDDTRKAIEEVVQFKDIYEDIERRINVLLYHRVADLKTAYSIIVGKKNFEEQIEYISSTYNLLRCDEDWSCVNKKSVALTFDDGYVDFYSTVYPILKKYNVPATVFVNTAGIDNDKEFWWDELECLLNQPILPNIIKTEKTIYETLKYNNREKLISDIRNDIIGYSYKFRDEEICKLKLQINPFINSRSEYRTMNSDELKVLAKDPLITIGAHTVNHILCDIETYEIQKKEIKESKDKLESIINKEVNLFAYPNGNIGVETRKILSELEFKRAFTCEHACIDYDEKVFDIPRSPVLNWDKNQVSRRFRGIWQTCRDY